jgi:hypothetical protein
MSEPSREDRIREYIFTMRQHFAAYHDHKEKMAYMTTALYLTGVSALIFQQDLAWLKTFPCAQIIRTTVFFSALVWIFVFWQLLKRYEAMVMVSACDTLRLQWLKSFETIPEEHLTEEPWHRIKVPQFLYCKIKQVSSITRILLAMAFPLATIIIWCAALAWRINTWSCLKI